MTTATSDFFSWEFDPTAPAANEPAAENDDAPQSADARKVPAADEAEFNTLAEKWLQQAMFGEEAERFMKLYEKELLRRFPDRIGNYIARSDKFTVEVSRGTRRLWDQEALKALAASASPAWIEGSFKVNLDKLDPAERNDVLDAFSKVARGRTTVKVTPNK